MNRKVIVHNNTDIIRDKKIHIKESLIQFEKTDGTLSDPSFKLCVEPQDAVAVLLYNKSKDRLIFVRQFRYPVYNKLPNERYVLEIPAGKIDPGETPEQAITREVLEETGYNLNNLHKIYTFFPSTGILSERVYLFYGEVTNDDKISSGGGILEENIDIVEISPDYAHAILDEGSLIDGKTMIALQWLRFNSMFLTV